MNKKEVNSNGVPVLHLYYGYNNIKEEVDKRTSFLGRFRSREEASHLLDLYRFSDDEQSLFDSFLKEAMAAIFMLIGKRTKGIDKAYGWDIPTSAVSSEFDNSIRYTIQWGENYNDNYIMPLDQHIFDAIVTFIIWRWLMLILKQDDDDTKRYAALYAGYAGNVESESQNLIGAVLLKTPRMY